MFKKFAQFLTSGTLKIAQNLNYSSLNLSLFITKRLRGFLELSGLPGYRVDFS